MKIIPWRLRELWRDMRYNVRPPSPPPEPKPTYIAVLWKDGEQRTFIQEGEPAVAIVVPVLSHAAAMSHLLPEGPSVVHRLGEPIFHQERYLRRYVVITDSIPGDGGKSTLAVYQYAGEVYPSPLLRAMQLHPRES